MGVTLHTYIAEPFKQQQFKTAGVEGLTASNVTRSVVICGTEK